MRDITDAEFDSVVVKAANIVVVDFWATWCAPCRAIAPQLEKYAEQYPNVTFVKINIDENQEKAAQFGIRSIPTIQVWTHEPGEDRAPVTIVGAKGLDRLPILFSTPQYTPI